MKLGDYVQSGDWKGEKHVPVIEAPEKVKAGEPFAVTLSVGKEIAHPNTAAHYIKDVKLYYVQDGGKFIVEVGTANFDVHGDSADPQNPGPALCEPCATFKVKLAKSGTFVAKSYCNIHGLWESSKTITVE